MSTGQSDTDKLYQVVVCFFWSDSPSIQYQHYYPCYQGHRIILTLRHSQKNVVGCMGDGINDASALHAANPSISVDKAADVVKEAADFVLLEKDLAVLAKGVEEGRKTFANTLKYVFMATSANFGNMFRISKQN
jgi:Mg2+-importing ATPase